MKTEMGLKPKDDFYALEEILTNYIYHDRYIGKSKVYQCITAIKNAGFARGELSDRFDPTDQEID